MGLTVFHRIFHVLFPTFKLQTTVLDLNNVMALHIFQEKNFSAAFEREKVDLQTKLRLNLQGLSLRSPKLGRAAVDSTFCILHA